MNCGSTYGDGAQEILEGCSDCGHKVFFYIRKEKMEQAQEQVTKLSDDDREQIEQDAMDLVGEKADEEKPVVLDFESVNISKPGHYELDLVKLFQKGQPVVYRLEDGKYVIDVADTFENFKQNNQ